MNDMPKLTREFFLEEDAAAERKRFEIHYTKELQRPVTIRDFSLDTIIKKCETVGFNDDLITQKVYDQVVRGAEDDEALLNNIARVVDMGSEIEVVPIITPDDMKIYPGGTGLTRSGGGVFDRVKLDCSSGKGVYKMDLGFEKWWKKSNSYGAMEEALWAAGNAIMRDVITKVIVDLETDVGTGMYNALANWGNDHYKALIKADSVIEAKGMRPDFVVVNPSEIYDILILDTFINTDTARAATGAPPRDGSMLGSLFGRIPIYSHRGATTAVMTMGVKDKAAIVGFYQPLTIEDYNDPREGLEGSVLSIQYDYKNGSDAEMTKGTQYAWAKVTGA